MPRIKLTKSAIDALPTPSSDVVYWDAAYPGFGVKRAGLKNLNETISGVSA
jgi:hypothetical protein